MTEHHRISVLTPTYNDSKYVAAAIESAMIQTYQDWELIIVDDGSTDDTPRVIRQFSDNRIKYVRQPSNMGQLNALAKGAELIHGDYVTILHSDDEFSDKKSFERNLMVLRNSDCDGLFSDLFKMNAQGQVYGILESADKIGFVSPALTFLRGGSNIITDIFWVRREVFANVFSNYILWNMPYWIRLEETGVGTLKLTKVEPWYKYRIYSENYIHSEIGKFESANGCLRTILEIGERINIPFLGLQRFLSRALKQRMKTFFRNGSSKPRELSDMVNYVLGSRFRRVPNNIYFDGLTGFYAHIPSTRIIELNFEDEEQVLLGKDARIFFNLIRSGKLPPAYSYILEEAQKGFGTVVVRSKDYEKARTIMRFLNLHVGMEGWRIIV